MATVKKIHNGHERSATAREIRDIAGIRNEDIIAAIQNTRATRLEVIQAFDWLEESHYTLSTFVKPMNERVRRVYEILDYAINGFEVERR